MENGFCMKMTEKTPGAYEKECKGKNHTNKLMSTVLTRTFIVQWIVSRRSRIFIKEPF